MNGRERCLAALNLEEPDIVPVAELNPGHYNPEKLKLDAISTSPSAPKNWGHRRIIDSNTYVDAWGVTTRTIPETGATAYTDYPIRSLEDLESYEPPDIDELSMRRIEATSKRIGGQKLITSGIGMEGTLSYQLLGFSGFMKAIYADRKLASKVNDMILSFAIKLGRAMIDSGVEAIWLGDDYGYRKGLFLPPAIIRGFAMPRLKRIVQAFHKAGAFVIKHSDGDNNSILGDIVETDVDAFHPVQPDVMDLGEVKERYGDKICMWGNIDCSRVLQDGTPDKVRREVRQCIKRASPGGGHVLGSSHSLHKKVKLENVSAMIDAGRRHGKYPILLQ